MYKCVNTKFKYFEDEYKLMGRIDAVIADKVVEEFRLATVKRLGGKKGDFSKALEEAMKMWIKKE